MSKFYDANGSIRVYQDAELVITDRLPSGTYTINYNPGFDTIELHRTSALTAPARLYGDIGKISDHIIDAFMRCDTNLGAMLSGVKGTGKSATIRCVSEKLNRMQIPTIIVNCAVNTYTLTDFLKNINSQRVLVIFDEFEKIFQEDENTSESDTRPSQVGLLSLLDGTMSQNHLYLFACNDINRVNEYMCNRPSRIRYRYRYTELSEAAIREYCNDNLDDPEKLEELVRVSRIVMDFSFDILKSLVDEINMYDITARECLGYMNIAPSRDSDMYEICIVEKDTHRTYTMLDSINLYRSSPDYIFIQGDELESPDEPDSKARCSKAPNGKFASISCGEQYKFKFNKENFKKIVKGVYHYSDKRFDVTLTRIGSSDGDTFVPMMDNAV